MNTVNTRFKIHRSLVAAMHGFQSTDGSRYAIMGTHFECHKDAVILVATDGRRMATYHYEHVALMPAGHDVVQFTADTTEALKLFRDAKKPWTVDLSDDGKEVRFSINKETAIITRNIAVEKSFPYWRSVIPTTEEKSFYEFVFNPELMKDFTNAARLLNPSGPSVRLVAHAGEGVNPAPYSVWLGDPNFYGLLMPMRNENSQRRAPAWACPEPKPAPVVPAPAPVAVPSPATGETTQPAPGAHAGSEQEGAHGFETTQPAPNA